MNTIALSSFLVSPVKVIWIRKSIFLVLLSVFSFALNAQLQKTAGLQIVSAMQPGAFPLVQNSKATSIITDTADAKVVSIAAQAVASDIELVSGARPAVVSSIQKSTDYLIIAGTIGHSAYIDQLIASKKLNVAAIQDKWESFIITTINTPFSGIKQAVVIAGSNMRGTAYGLFELSKMAGVSPWVWWADATPASQKALYVLPGTITAGEPSVKYRGIFLNDEDWGLQPWAAKTFEPATGDIGPKTYAKIFELLLRLKANLIWPAMHPSTKAFFHYPGNVKVAEEYGIIIGSSHAEPMLRNNVDEWNEKTMGHFNYLTNKDSIYKYWEDRVKQSRGINAIYSIGMRGIHDGQMEGVKDLKEAVPIVEGIMQDERALLSKYINPDATKVPQVLTPYKEVLDIYDNGLKVPEDVTLVWPDDNYGYISRLNGAEEASRSGGSGVYYHASYWGRPHDYLWLSSTHPSLIQEEMMKACKNGSSRLWVLNVGDIKPLEYNIEYFLNMAYDATAFKDASYTKQHLLNWAENLFGKDKASQIRSVLWEYYQLAFERRPEFMGWSQTEPTTKTNYTAFNHFFYGDEAQRRLNRYEALEEQVKALRSQIAPKEAAAFYQLVYYPVVGASLMNKKFLYRDKSYLYAKQGRASAADYARLSQVAYDSIVQETDYFNNRLSGGKWKYMMSMKPRDLPVYQEPVLPETKVNNREGWGIAPEGFVTTDSSLLPNATTLQLPPFDPLNQQQYFIDIFLKGSKAVNWIASVSNPRIQLSQTTGELKPVTGKKDTRLYVTIDWNKASGKKDFNGNITFSGNGEQFSVAVTGNALSLPSSTGRQNFIENNGYVSMFAAHCSKQINKGSGDWKRLPNQGYTGDALETGTVELKDTLHIRDTGWLRQNGSYVEYNFYTFKPANATATVYTLPTHPLNKVYSMRYAVSVDGGPLQIVDFCTYGRSEEWKQNVLSNRAERKVNLSFVDKGPHTLCIYSIDPGVILQSIVIDLGGLKKAYSAIPETVVGVSRKLAF